ncbi:MAG: (2Fe-2S) ferredoxin domain-containing protein, partial [Deltaproteobacteria bacterium]|nr:(2Fe-2S) ferredoxin domain-containing protein [Deltaproteobacteria bacterium]
MLPRHAAKIETPEDLKRFKKTILAEKPHAKSLVVCCGTGCLASGSLKVRESLEREIRAQAPDEDIVIRMTGCRGFCESGPLVVVGPDDTFYHGVNTDDVPEIVSESVVKDHTVERLLYEDSATGQQCPHEADIP